MKTSHTSRYDDGMMVYNIPTIPKSSREPQAPYAGLTLIAAMTWPEISQSGGTRWDREKPISERGCSRLPTETVTEWCHKTDKNVGRVGLDQPRRPLTENSFFAAVLPQKARADSGDGKPSSGPHICRGLVGQFRAVR